MRYPFCINKKVYWVNIKISMSSLLVTKPTDKLKRDMVRMLAVTDIQNIIFEENDGTEIPFTDLFDYRTSIGAGGFGFVVAALDKHTGEEVALKLLFKDDSSQKVIDLFKKEAELLESFDHPNVVKFKFLKNFSNYLCLGMELCVGGNLTEWVKHKRSVNNLSIEEYEEEWSKIIKNVLLGLQYIHDTYEIIHRDIKPGNILFLHKNDISSLKIWDFGLATKVGSGLFDQNYEKVGTIMYQAPEQMIDTSYYSKPIDIWAAGMIMYELLSKGGHPILGKDIYKNLTMTVNDYKNAMKNNESCFKITKRLKSISKMAKSLLKFLCHIKPNHRYNANRALKHPWITRKENGVIPLNINQELELKLISNVTSARNMISVEKFTDSEDSASSSDTSSDSPGNSKFAYYEWKT